MKTNEKTVFPLILLAILVIFLLIPYKGYINKRVYDPKVNYQVFRKINREYLSPYDNCYIIKSNINNNMNVYFEHDRELYFAKNVEKLLYLETYTPPGTIYIDENYTRRLLFYKNKKYIAIFYGLSSEIDEKTYLEYMKELSGRIEAKKKIKPFILKLQTPEEFYNNYKEYFFPYYLGDYEYKGNN